MKAHRGLKDDGASLKFASFVIGKWSRYEYKRKNGGEYMESMLYLFDDFDLDIQKIVGVIEVFSPPTPSPLCPTLRDATCHNCKIQKPPVTNGVTCANSCATICNL